jgi:hypothetical protein
MEDGKQDETQVGIRMSLSVRKLLERAAAKDKRKLSDWARTRLIDRARTEIHGEAPPLESVDPEDAITIEAIRRAESQVPMIRADLLELAHAAMQRPRLARVLSELAAEARGDAPSEAGAQRRTGRRRRLSENGG